MDRQVRITIDATLADPILLEKFKEEEGRSLAQGIANEVAEYLLSIAGESWCDVAAVYVERGATAPRQLPSVEALTAGREAFAWVSRDDDTDDPSLQPNAEVG